MEQQVSYHSLVYELERIYTYLASELGNPAAKGYVPLQDRLRQNHLAYARMDRAQLIEQQSHGVHARVVMQQARGLDASISSPAQP